MAPLPLLVLLLLLAGLPALDWPPTARPLPISGDHLVLVADVAELVAAVAGLRSDTTILLAPGTYRLAATLVIDGVDRVALRGATGDPADVHILGRGMHDSSLGNCLTIAAVDRFLLADLTIGDCYWHAVQVQGERGCSRPVFHNLHLTDTGEQHLKGSDDAANTGCDGGRVQYCRFDYSAGARSDYIGGIDVHGGADWLIRDCLFDGIQAPDDRLAGPAILMWSESRDTVIERCVFRDCSRAIVLGLEDKWGAGRGFHDHQGGLVRNNFVYRGPGAHQGPDVGIHLGDSPGTRVEHNTVLLSGSYANAIEYRFAGTTGVTISNNCCDAAIRQRDGATAVLRGNRSDAVPAWFVQAGGPELGSAAPALADPDDPAVPPVDLFRRRPGPVVDPGCAQRQGRASRIVRLHLDVAVEPIIWPAGVVEGATGSFEILGCDPAADSLIAMHERGDG